METFLATDLALVIAAAAGLIATGAAILRDTRLRIAR